MKALKTLGVALVAFVAVAGCVRAESFTWNLNSGASIGFSGVLGTDWDQTVQVLGSSGATGALATQGDCNQPSPCSLSFKIPVLAYNGIDTFTLGAGTFSITGIITNPTGGANFSGTLVAGTVGGGALVRSGKFYNFDIDPTASVPSVGFISGIIAAFKLPTLAQFFPYTGPLDFSFKSPVVQSGTAFSGTSAAGSLILDPAPETSTLLLFGGGLLALGLLRFRLAR